jgi:2',3'-cyclic-nucleotide 2'-phosphodiesterase (5'-nucleotidase family)
MIKKLIFAAGAGIGYVLGTRAGRQKYEAMVVKARQVMDRPDVKEATEAIQAQANRLYEEGRHIVRERVRDLRDRTERRHYDTDATLEFDEPSRYAAAVKPVRPPVKPVPPPVESFSDSR